MEKDMSGALNIAAWVLAYVFSREAAQAISPYLLIILASFGGAFISLWIGERFGVLKSIGYVFTRIFVACVLAIPLAEILNSFFPSIKIYSAMPLFAFAIGMVSDFKKLRGWFVGIFKAKAESLLQKNGGEK